ncbi:hypothetical protein Hanom_Chr12g01180511 [Helianthus anomalus]
MGGEFKLIRVFCESMRPEFDAHIGIIQCWAHILNYEEIYKAPESPLRLFCTKIMLNRLAYDKTTKVNFRYKEFNRNMATVLKNARFKGEQEYRNIKDYELVFVLIIWDRHYYIVCFNIKHERVDVLDNNANEDKLGIKKSMLDRWKSW